MILVDTSVWINHWRDVETKAVMTLRHEGIEDRVVIGDLVLFEALQGARDDAHARKLDAALSCFPLVDLLGPEMARAAAANYRRLRSIGITPRRNADLLIATYCIETKTLLLHDDIDFTAIARHLPLRVV